MEAKIRTGAIKTIGDGLGDQPDGSFVADHIVSVFDNVDHVGDSVYRGAFVRSLSRIKAATANGHPMAAYYAHRMDDPNMCVGTVLSADEVYPGDARLDGVEGDAGKNGGLLARIKYDATPTAKRVVEMIKDGRLTQSSFTYDVLDGEWISEEKARQNGDSRGSHYALKELDLLELGPCQLGCNDQTTVVGVKERQAAVRRATVEHEDKGVIPLSAGPKKCVDGAWDGPKEKADIPADATAAQLAAFFAWRDSDGDATAKDSYRFIHHTVGDDGHAAAANLKACVTGIGILNGGRGGTTIPEADVKGVYAHLAAHIREAGQEPPELKSRSEGKDYVPAPYSREPDETVECVNCGKYNSDDARFCDQCGHSLTEPGSAVEEKSLPSKAGRALSGKNEEDLRQSVTLIQGVLSSVATDDSGKADGGAGSDRVGGSKDNDSEGDRPTETKAAEFLSLELSLLELDIDN